jgi:hypothetical protein
MYYRIILCSKKNNQKNFNVKLHAVVKILKIVYLKKNSGGFQQFINFFFNLLQCMWCPTAKLCSDGYDRNKQEWLKRNCDKSQYHLNGDPDTCADEAKYRSKSNDQTYHVNDDIKDDYTQHEHDISDHDQAHLNVTSSGIF